MGLPYPEWLTHPTLLGPRQRLLEEGAYQAPDAARAAGARKQALEVVARSIGRGAPVAYHVTDRAPERGSRDWARVVAVFVTGAAWQFKGWPFKARPTGAVHGVPRTRAGHGRRVRARAQGGRYLWGCPGTVVAHRAYAGLAAVHWTSNDLS